MASAPTNKRLRPPPSIPQQIWRAEDLDHFDPIHGVAWIHDTTLIEAPEDRHIFRDHERVRLLTYGDLHPYLEAARLRPIHCYPD